MRSAVLVCAQTPVVLDSSLYDVPYPPLIRDNLRSSHSDPCRSTHTAHVSRGHTAVLDFSNEKRLPGKNG